MAADGAGPVEAERPTRVVGCRRATRAVTGRAFISGPAIATAISRLRGKIKYRPVVFELMPDRFTLSSLQRAVEGILGLSLHTQNFRRALDKTGFVIGTGAMETSTGGRPAELYSYNRDSAFDASTTGLSAPRKTAD